MPIENQISEILDGQINFRCHGGTEHIMYNTGAILQDRTIKTRYRCTICSVIAVKQLDCSMHKIKNTSLYLK